MPAGSETETTRREISVLLNRSGFNCRKSEIDVSTRGDRVLACWIFPKGVAGSLSYNKGREQWLPEPAESCLELPE